MKKPSSQEDGSLDHKPRLGKSADNFRSKQKHDAGTSHMDNRPPTAEALQSSVRQSTLLLRGDNGDPKLGVKEDKSKRQKEGTAEIKSLPPQYEHCDVRDVVQLIGEMLLDLIRINDRLPLQDDSLTRFHSRVPPAISVMDYLHRLATHANLSPPILLSMVYYIDKLCALYPAFTITSLTVHRYLIASATVASKGLSDTFWTNSTYARVGGVSVKELGLLELELLRRIDWRIVPRPEVLVEYYRSLVDRSEGFQLLDEASTDKLR